MELLVQLVRAYLQARTLEERMLAANELFRIVGPELYGFILRRCPESSSEDVLQETLTSITKGLRDFQGDTDRAFWSWCYAITRRRIYDASRSERATREVRMDTEELWRTIEAGNSEEPMPPGVRLDLEYALDLLAKAKPPCRDYLWLYYIRDWDYQAIAEEYNLTSTVMRMRINRCLELAQSLLADER